MQKFIGAAIIAVGLFGAVAAYADEPYVLTLKDHQFTPADLEVPAHQKIKITVKNLDTTAEEFESHDLKREKVVTGNGQITLMVGPLEPGTYHYVGEYHEDVAKGTITVK